MKYAALFSLAVTHSYYPDRKCPDFVLEPTAATVKILNNHRLVLKQEPYGIVVLSPVTAQQQMLIALEPETTFGFRMRLISSSFPLFTALSALAEKAVPVYTNVGATELPRLALTAREASNTEAFAVVTAAAQESFTLGGRPLDGAVAGDFALVQPTTVQAVSAYDPQGKIMTVDSAAAAQGHRFSVTYPVRPRTAPGVFAEIDIRYDSLLQTPPSFEIPFTAKEARWKYYVAANRTPDGIGDGYQIARPNNNGENDGVAFPDADRTDLRQNPDEADEVAVMLAQQYPEAVHLFRFVSDALIPCNQVARKELQLKLDGHTIFENLPNPSYRNVTRHTSGQGNQKVTQDALFHVIRYINPLLLTSSP